MGNLHPEISPVEAGFWDAIRVIGDAYRLQRDVAKALTEGLCPSHFQQIWDVHVKPEVVETILAKVAHVLLCDARSHTDTVRKFVLIEMIAGCDLLAGSLPFQGDIPAGPATRDFREPGHRGALN